MAKSKNSRPASKKGVRYPAKFRMKLEKIAAEKDRREAMSEAERMLRDEPDQAMNRMANTLWKENSAE